MVDWMQIGKDYFLFILFIIACTIFIIYRIWNMRRLKSEARTASQMMHKPSFAPIPPPWEPPPRMANPPITEPEQNEKLSKFDDDVDEIPVETRRDTVEPTTEKEEEFQDLFSDVIKPTPPKQTDVMNALGQLTEDMKTNSDVLQGTLEEDLTSLKTKLSLITQRREEIKKYGRLLGDLYKRYEHREKQLQIMVIGLERLEEMRDSAVNPSISDQ